MNLTAKVSKLNKNKTDKLVSLHKLLTRLDVEKDGRDKNVIEEDALPYFYSIINRYFGDIGSYDSAYKTIGEHINSVTNTSFGSPYVIDANVDIRNRDIEMVNHITHAFYDAGASPLKYSNTITIKQTPASYLDAANKTKSFDVPEPYGFNLVPTYTTLFKDVGLPIHTIASKWNEQTGGASFILDFGFIKLFPSFAGNLHASNEDGIEFFSKGNKTKNEWFQAGATPVYQTCSKDQTALLYIICKELGDLLHAYYAKEFLSKLHYTRRKSVSVFTNDKLLVRRCQLFGIPVILSTAINIYNKTTSCYYIVPAMSNITTEMYKLYLSYTKQSNDNVIKDIKLVLINGYYMLHNGTKIPISQVLKNELLQICENINKKTLQLSQFNYDMLTHNEYRLIVRHFLSTHILDGTQKTFNILPDSLFIAQKDTQLIHLKTLLQTGGSDMQQSYKFDMSLEPVDFTNIIWIEEGDMLETYSVSTLVLNVFYTQLQKLYHDKSKDELCYLACDMYAIYRIYFTYLGFTPFDRDFYDECIRRFDEVIKNPMTFHEFLHMYKKYNSDLDLSQYPSIESILAKIPEPSIANTPIPKMQIPILATGGRKRQTYKKRKLTH